MNKAIWPHTYPVDKADTLRHALAEIAARSQELKSKAQEIRYLSQQLAQQTASDARASGTYEDDCLP